MAPEDGLTITLKDVYIQVLKVQESVAPVTTHTGQLVDHESRLRTLERWRYSAHAALGMSLGSIITALLNRR